MKQQCLSDAEWECSRCKKIFVPTTKIRSQAITRNSQFVYCSRKCLNERRLHPESIDLFFCFGCNTYKTIDAYYKQKTSKYGISVFCKICHNFKQKIYFDNNTGQYRKVKRKAEAKRRERIGKEGMSIINKNSYYTNRENRVKSSVAYIKQRRVNDPKWNADKRRRYKKNIVVDIRDCYVRDILRLEAIPVMPETIELKREQIIMKRTLKEFKKFRKENYNESDHANVYGVQQSDEENHEGRI
jgi:hypothetical protein